jgi:hypothetical protein
MTYQTINPANGKVVKTYEGISDAALSEVMDVAQACYENDWRQRSVAQRAAIVPDQHQVNRRYYLWRAIFQYRNSARCGSPQCRARCSRLTVEPT